MDLFADSGSTVEEVTTLQNTPGVMTPILKVKPDRGQFLRFLNYVSKGQGTGLPMYFKLRSAADTPLPTNTNLQLQASVAGMNGRMNVSELVQSISFWNNNDLTTQKNKDNVHNAKVVLTYPESSGKTGAKEYIDVRDIDEFFVSIQSPAQVLWDVSSYYFDNTAVNEYSRQQG